MTDKPRGAFGPDNDLVDYILGITFEIWEAGRVDLIDQYYAPDTVVYSLDGMVHGARQMIDGTRSMLNGFPDRLLLGDDVICSGDARRGYSSHRVLSPMTNTGPSAFGPATGRSVRIMNMADCVIEDGVITREWLARDNFALVTQLGFDIRKSARLVAERRGDDAQQWFKAEAGRVEGRGQLRGNKVWPANAGNDFAQQVISNNWFGGNRDILEKVYAPYAVLHRSPVQLVSGRERIDHHFAELRAAFRISGASVDHIAVQPHGANGLHFAARWAVAGNHTGRYLGHPATNKPVFVMGITHWRIIDGRIAVEWSVFDSLGILAQLV
jgi:predicted ester cyclase